MGELNACNYKSCFMRVKLTKAFARYSFKVEAKQCLCILNSVLLNFLQSKHLHIINKNDQHVEFVRGNNYLLCRNV